MTAKELIQESLRNINSPDEELEHFDFNTPGLHQTQTYTEGWDEYLKEFSEDIEKYYDENKLSKEEFDKKIETLKEIQLYLEKNVFNKPINGTKYEIREVFPFGVSASGLGMKGDGLDMTICVNPPTDFSPTEDNLCDEDVIENAETLEKEVQKKCISILEKICKAMRSGEVLENRAFEKWSLRFKRRKVPVIKGKIDEMNVEIRISMSDFVSPEYLSLNFISICEKYDKRFMQLASFIWGWQQSKNSPRLEDYHRTVFPDGTTTVLMVLFFMKHYKLLPTVKVKRNGREVADEVVESWQKSNRCEVSLGTLFLLYIDFYANAAELFQNKLCIDDGTLKIQGYKDHWWCPIIITDETCDGFPATTWTDVMEFRKLLLAAQKVVRNVKAVYIQRALFAGGLIPKISFHFEKKFRKAESTSDCDDDKKGDHDDSDDEIPMKRSRRR